MSVIKCPQCNLVNFAGAITCKRCSYPFEEVATVVNQPQMVQSQPNFIPPGQPPQTWTPPNQNQPNYQNQYQPNYQPDYRQNSSQSKKLAIFSMIFGILSFPLINFTIGAFLSGILAFGLGVAGAIIGFVVTLSFLPTGLISGIVALVRANKRPDEFGGKGFAITGIVLSGFAIVIIPLIAAIAIPNLLAARRAANESSALANLKVLVKSQKDYNLANKTTLCADLKQFALNKSIDKDLANGTKNGYKFTTASTTKGCEFFATPATATGVSASGTRSFYASTEEDMIRGAAKNGLPADKTDTPVASVYNKLGGQSEDSNTTEITVVSNLQKIYAGQNYLYSNFKEYSGNLREMRAKQLISSTLANGEELGYIYVLKLTPSGGYEVFATPISPQQRSFYMNQDGIIHAGFNNGSAASKSDPAID